MRVCVALSGSATLIVLSTHEEVIAEYSAEQQAAEIFIFSTGYLLSPRRRPRIARLAATPGGLPP